MSRESRQDHHGREPLSCLGPQATGPHRPTAPPAATESSEWQRLERRRGSAVPGLAPLSDAEAFHIWLRQLERRAVGRGIRWPKVWPVVGRDQLRSWFEAGRSIAWTVEQVVGQYLVALRAFDAPLV